MGSGSHSVASVTDLNCDMGQLQNSSVFVTSIKMGTMISKLNFSRKIRWNKG